MKISLFGTFDAQVDGKSLPPLRSVKGQYLLALLALRHDKDVSRLWLAETLWPDSLQAEALGSLRQSLADLRRALGTEADRLQAPTRTLLRLEVSNADVDTIAFDSAIKRKEREGWKQAVALYHGPLLGGASEPWILSEREERQQGYLNALENLAALAHAEGDRAGEIAHLRRIVLCDPLRENVQRDLMQVLFRSGEVQAALNTYHDLHHSLHQELGAQPGEETRAVYEQIRHQIRKEAGQQTKQKAGQCRSVFTSAAPQSGSVAGNAEHPPGNVPLPLSSLIGRENALRDIKASVFMYRLVTLVGTGGVGKTRLAVQAANELREDFEDGTWFVDFSLFASTAAVERVAQEMAGLLGVVEQPGRSRLQTLQDALRSRQMLFVLDNCETLLDVGRQLAQALLQTCQNVHLLVTSRQRLGMTSETVFPAVPLTLPTAEDAVSVERLDAPAARLFVERAQAVHPSFLPNKDNTPAIIEICRRLDGLPLALELAAALCDVLTPGEIAARLNDRFALLGEQDRTRPPRHQTLRAVIESSASLLSSNEQTLLRRLSVFVGGWTLDAAEAVCQGDGSLFSSLRSLVSKSLVVAEERDGQMRYRLLESLREYAGEELAKAGEIDALRTRHLEYYLRFACRAKPELTGPQQGVWLEKLEAETGNLRAALEWAEERGGNHAQGLHLVGALGRYWQIRGHFAEGRQHLLRLLDMPEAPSDPTIRANALNWAGLLSVFQGDFTTAQALCEQAYTLWQSVGNEAGAAGSLGILGIVAANRGELDQARRLYGQALERARAVDDRPGVAGTLGYLGIVAVSQGYYEEARTYYAESLALRRKMEDVWGIGASLNNLGLLARRMGDLQLARDLLHQTLAIRRNLRDRRSMGITLNVLAHIAWQQGDLQTAATYQAEAQELFARLGDQRSIAYGLEMQARLAVSEGQAEQAGQLYERARQLREAIGAPLPPAEHQELERDLQPALLRLGGRE